MNQEKKDIKILSRNKKEFRLNVCRARIYEMQLIILCHVRKYD